MAGPEFFERLATTSSDGLWLLDAEGRTLYANPAMAALLGRSVEEMAQTHAHDVLDDQGRVDFDANMVDLVAGSAGHQNIETLLHRADRSPLWALTSTTPFPEPDGTVLSWLHRVTEYTERRELVESLRSQESQLTAAQSIAHLGSWEWVIATGAVAGSEEFHRIYGLDERAVEATYDTLMDFLHPEDRPSVDAAIVGVVSGARSTFDWEGRIRAGDGATKWLRGRGRGRIDEHGELLSMHGTIQDVTDLKVVARKAQAANDRLRAHLAVAEAANSATSLAGALEHITTAVPTRAGWAPIGVFVRDGPEDPVRPADLAIEFDPEGLMKIPGEDLRIAGRAWDSSRVLIEPLGPGPGAVVAIPVRRDGEVICVLEVFLARLEAAEDSRELIIQIGQQLGTVADREQTARRLARAVEEAMTASALKSDFLATMSHEIRTPMNGVIGLTDLLLETDLDARQQGLAQALRESGRTLLSIINDILDLSKIESGRLELDLHEFDVRDVAEQALALQSGPVAEKGLELVLDLSSDVPERLVGDAVRFGQIIANLCSNAVKFTDEGEVVCRLELAPTDENPAADADVVVIHTSVTDSGIGIDPGSREHLFEPFTQGDPSTTRRHGGTGLGLTICQRLTSALGGEIGVQDSGGPRGSRFWFTARFTRAASAPESDSARRPPAHPALAGRRALLVEDNHSAAVAAAAMLREWGIDVEVAVETDAAHDSMRAAAARGTAYDVVLVDHSLPGADVAAFVAGLDAQGRALPVLVMGGPAGRPSVGDDRTDPVVPLDKPIRSRALHEALLGAWGLDQPSTRPDDSPTTQASRSRVLVVEDNPVNQLVAAGFLEGLGCEVESVGHGAAAVERLSGEHGFSLVLMDCRMPQMDGYDATRAIRAAEAARTPASGVPRGRLPIVAMTASVLAGERERCLDAGMDDFLTKPIGAEALDLVLRRWVPTDKEPRILDLQRAGELASMVKDGTTFFDRARGSFLARVEGMVRRIEIAVDEGEASTVADAAHALSGSASNLGLQRLGAVAAEIELQAEQQAREGRLDDPVERTRLLALVRRRSAEAVEALEALDSAHPRAVDHHAEQP